jgi:hypothetical protein
MPPALITLYNSLNFPESIAIRHRDPSHFQIAFDGTITFGRFNTATLDIANPTVIRPFVGSN